MLPTSIRYGIPLLIVVFTVVLAAYTTQREWGAAEAVVRGEEVSQMISRMILLQKQFGYAFATGNHEGIAQEMSLLGGASEPQIAILADDTDIVLGATKGEWVGRSLAEVARAQWPRWPSPYKQIERVRAAFSGELYLAAAGRYVLGIYPISFGTVGEGGRPQRVAVLLVQRDLLRHLLMPAHGREATSGTRKNRVGVAYRRRRL